jgi:hypothetical protein
MKKAAERPKFTQISRNEVKIDYKGNKFMLIEKSRGTYGLGSAIQLYHLDGFDKKHLKEVGWTNSDNHSCSGMRNALIPTFTNMEECKKAAIKYIDQLM